MECKVNLRLIEDGESDSSGFGHGVVTLLQGIEKYGSINKSTKAMGMAYSKAWTIINEAEDRFHVTLIDRDGPRGSSLTEDAHKYIEFFNKATSAAQEAANKVLKEYFK